MIAFQLSQKEAKKLSELLAVAEKGQVLRIGDDIAIKIEDE